VEAIGGEVLDQETVNGIIVMSMSIDERLERLVRRLLDDGEEVMDT
jgi:hypothetical protein